MTNPEMQRALALLKAVTTPVEVSPYMTGAERDVLVAAKQKILDRLPENVVVSFS